MDRKRLTFMNAPDWETGAPERLEDPGLYDGIRVKRVIAYLIDMVAIFVLAIVLYVAGGLLSVITLGVASPLVALAFTLLPFAYHTWLIGGPGNATLGMKAMGIRVIAWNGSDPGYLQAAAQTVLFYVTLTVGGLLLLASLFSERGRCLHDLLCGSIVINDRRDILDIAPPARRA